MHERDDEDRVGWEAITAFAIMGGIVVCLLFANIWDGGGLITSYFSGERLLCVLAAIVYGMVIGWMIHPRRPFASLLQPGGIDAFIGDFQRTHPDSLKFMRRTEGEPPRKG